MNGIDDEPRTDPPPRASRLPMRYARSTILLGLTFVLAAFMPASCNTSAVGIEQCRQLEYARCEAAVHCPSTFDFDDVESCKRFYRDQCLHGLDVSEAPDKSDVNACVEVINQLGSCAAKDEETLVVDCDEVSSTVKKVDLVCELLKRPEAAPECAFVVDTEDGEGGSAGESGSGGSAGESSAGAGGSS